MSNPPPNFTYDDAVTAGRMAQTAQEERQKGFLDQRYYKGIPGLMKLIEAVLSIIAYLCVELTAVTGIPPATVNYFKFVTMGAFVATIVVYILLLLKIPQRCLRCDCVNWPFVEVVYYGAFIIFYFFADLMMSIQASEGGHKAAAAFGWFAMAAFVADLVLSFRVWWAARKGAREAAYVGQADPSVTVDNKY